MELPTPGVSACNVTAVGYSPSAGLTDLLVPNTFNPTTGTAEIIVQAPPSAADMSLETIVTYYNYEAPPAQLKLCKVAGNGVTVGTSFSFITVNITDPGKNYTSTPTVVFSGCSMDPMATAIVSNEQVTGIELTSPGSCSSAPMVTFMNGGGSGAMATAAIAMVEAGPSGEEGYCQVVSSNIEVGTSGTVTETVPAGDGLPTVTVNGVSTPLNPAARQALPPPSRAASLSRSPLALTKCPLQMNVMVPFQPARRCRPGAGRPAWPVSTSSIILS
jgi:hypothetical protein